MTIIAVAKDVVGPRNTAVRGPLLTVPRVVLPMTALMVISAAAK